MSVLLLSGFTFLTQNLCAQTKSEDETTIIAEKIVCHQDPQFECKKISFNEKTRVTILENVSLNSGKFQFKNAGKVIYDQKARKLSVYDGKNFSIQGKIVMVGTAKKNIVEYTIENNTAYIL